MPLYILSLVMYATSVLLPRTEVSPISCIVFLFWPVNSSYCYRYYLLEYSSSTTNWALIVIDFIRLWASCSEPSVPLNKTSCWTLPLCLAHRPQRSPTLLGVPLQTFLKSHFLSVLLPLCIIYLLLHPRLTQPLRFQVPLLLVLRLLALSSTSWQAHPSKRRPLFQLKFN